VNNLYITADTHFGYAAVLTKMKRFGFRDIEDHDRQVLDCINAKVDVEDFLIIVGDFAHPGKARYYRNEIKCSKVIMVLGNHDKRGECTEVFGCAHDMYQMPFLTGELSSVFCHYPMAFWDNSHKGAYHFYGHCHTQREATLDTAFPQRRSMDVGVDNAMRLLGKPEPFHEQELLDILKDRSGHDPVEFYL